jgi:serine/threonine-protein kinase
MNNATPTEEGNHSASLGGRMEAVCDRAEAAWKAGRRPTIEDYLGEVPEAGRAALFRELLALELTYRRRVGERPTPQDYSDHFPEHAALIEAVFGGPTASGGIGGGQPTLRQAGAGRYQLLGEIGRGGMGAVLKGRDPDLVRDLAVKVLLEEHRDDPELVRRFIEEAQIGGQLQHPGIVPVHELGQLDDGRPYFTMKLVKGRTLSALLADREAPVHERPRFLGIFEQVCQTVAYAHARGVIHRDLKPSNIMVGAFGEVQVMDWGLAKVLPRAGDGALREQAEETTLSIIRTMRSGSDADASRPGSAMGTPAYMAPEQARGEIEGLSERSDVFGLGSILCEILIGEPAYTGGSREAIFRKARRGETADALKRLDGCGLDAELVALARRCLEVDPEARPRDAGEVARRLTAYLAGVQERLRAAELARAAERARAEEARATAEAAERARVAEAARAEAARAAAVAAEGRARAERRARRMTVGLAASLVALLLCGGGAGAWMISQRQAWLSRVEVALMEAELLRNLAASDPAGDLGRWQAARAAARRLLDLRDGGPAPSVQVRIDELAAQVEKGARAAESERILLDKLVDIRSAKADDPDGSIGDAAYADAFRAAGIDVVALAPAEVGARIKAWPSVVAAALAAALDDWASVRRSRRKDRRGAARLSEVANAADPDPWRVDLRRAIDLPHLASRAEALRDLAASMKSEAASAVDFDLLGTALEEVGDAKAEDRLRDGRRRFPRDVWLNFDLARLLEMQSRPEEAIRYCSIARALRPETAHRLAHALAARGESDEALAVFDNLVQLRPKDGRHWACYVNDLLRQRGDRPRSDEAIAKAVAILRETVRLRPEDAGAHHRLGYALRAQGELSDAIDEYREAIRIQPDNTGAHTNLGIALRDQGKPDEAIAAFREAIRLRPDNAGAHFDLGLALRAQGKLDEAIAAFREAILSRRDYASFHAGLGDALAGQGKLDEAIAEYREAIRLRPDYAPVHFHLGGVLKRRGRFREALDEYRRGHEPGSKLPDGPSGAAEELHQAELYVALEARLPAVLRGDEKPRDAAEGLVFAEMAYIVGRPVSSARLFDAALRADPKLAEDPRPGRHYNAACAAALAGAGRGEDKAPPDGEERARWRKQAVAWLAAELALWTKRVEPGLSQAQDLVVRTLRHWKQDTGLAGIRDAAAIQALPEDERKACRALWTDVDALVERAEGGLREDAIAEYREAIRLKPDFAVGHYNLGNALRAQGRPEDAIAEYREAIRLEPNHAAAHYNLVDLLERQGHFREALDELRKGHELGSNRPDWQRDRSDDRVRRAERMAALEGRLPAVLRGEDKPRDAAEGLAFADMAYKARRYVLSARLFDAALRGDSRLTGDLRSGHRYNAACAAALAGAGQGEGKAPPDEEEKARWRKQAVAWLAAELALSTKRVEPGPSQAQDLVVVVRRLRHWKQDIDLAGIRDAAAIQALPEDERKACLALWTDVDALLERAERLIERAAQERAAGDRRPSAAQLP